MSRRTLAIAVLALLGPALGVLSHRIASRGEEVGANARFRDAFTDRAARLESSLSVLGEALHATRSLFESSVEVTPEEFATFTAHILDRHPEVRSIRWAPRSPTRAGFPVLYVEPRESNLEALGADLSTEPGGRRTTVSAVESGSLAVLVGCPAEDAPADTVTALLPVYRASPAREREAKGLVVLVIDAAELLGRALRLDRPEWRHTVVLAGGPDGELCPVGFNGRSREIHETNSECRFVLGGREWLVSSRPTAAFLRRHSTRQPIVIGIAVTVLWCLLLALLGVLERWSRDHAVRRQDRVLRAVCRSIQEGVVVADRDGRFLVSNDAAEQMVGMGSLDVAADSWSDAYGCFLPDTTTPYPADDLPLARAIRGESVDETEMFVRNRNAPDGVWLSASGSPLRDENDELAGGVIVLRDVTAKKRSEQAVRRLSRAVEQTADSVLITDQEGMVQYVNPAFEETTGYRRAEVVGKPPQFLISTQAGQSERDALWERVFRGEVYQGTTVNRRKDGRPYHVEQTITPIRDGTGKITHCVSVGRDMTERMKRREQAIEMRVASAVQKRLYPAGSPGFHGLDIAGAVDFAEDTCGDYIDYIRMPGGRVGLVIGDVSGHGLVSALIMTQVRAYLRPLARTTTDVAEILTGVNRFLVADLEEEHFVTLLLVSIDPETGRVEYANAGHTPGCVLDAAGRVKDTLARTGLPLGVLPRATYELRRDVVVEPGEILALVTDGVTEKRDDEGRMFDESRVLEVIASHRGQSADEIVGRLRSAVSTFGGKAPPEDDVSMIVCKRLDPAAVRAARRLRAG